MTAEQLAALPTTMQDYAIFALDPGGHVTSWSAGAERIEGYRSDEIIGRHFSVFYPAEVSAGGTPDRELTQAATKGVFIDQGWRMRRGGNRFWAHVVISAQRSSRGELTGFIKVVRDDSAVRARLERAGQRFSDLFDLAPVGIGIFDEAQRVLDANGALSDMLGHELPELVGMVGSDLLHDREPSPSLLPCTSQATATASQLRTQRTVRGADGEPVVCELHSAASVQDDGRHFWLVVFQDVTEQTRRTELLHHQATHDQLTGLPNRQGVQELLDRLLDNRPDELAVLFCDLDNFKRVNDSLSHEAGDELLRAVARRLRNELPSECTPARLYGDEFLIVCADVVACGGLAKLTATIVELLRMVATVRGRPVHLSASIGAATVADSHTTGEDLIRYAGAAMLQAKNQPERAAVAGPSLIRSVNGQLPLERYLRSALDEDKLQLHYQPVVTADGCIVLAEALLRAPNEGGSDGSFTPEVLLSTAKKAGLLGELDRWVLRTALLEAATWPESVAISVNLAGLRPDEPGFTDTIAEALETCGVAGHRVVLEMVESVFVDLPAGSRSAMAHLHDLGIRFAMDDFGTGYSSLARLKELPTQILKLDQRFVSGLDHHTVDMGIVRAIVSLAEAMGRYCIAEGVETAPQFRLLRDLGVEAYQGWLFSRDLPVPEFRALLTKKWLPTPQHDGQDSRS